MSSAEDHAPHEPLMLPRPGWKGILFLVLLPLGLIGLGLYGYAQQRLHGDVVTHMRSVGSGGAAWGVYIMSYIFLVGIAVAGVAIATVSHLFRMRDLRHLSRLSEAIAVVALVMGMMCVMADQGRPLVALFNLPMYARVASPFFGSFTLIVGVDVAASLVMLYLGGRGDAAWCGRKRGPLRWAYKLWASGYAGSERELRRHRKARFWLSLAIFPFIIIAFSTLGFIFGIQGGRPGWYGALRAPSMLVISAIAGVGLIGAVAGILHVRLKAEQALPARMFLGMGNAMIVLISIFLYLLLVETLTERYAGRAAELRVANAIVFGPYAPAYWTMVGSLLLALAILGVQFLRRKPMVGGFVVAGLLGTVAGVLRRFLVIVPGQTHGNYLDYPTTVYWPNANELMVLGGILGIGILAVVIFMWLFPIVPVYAYYGRKRGELEPEPARRGLLRRTLAGATLVVGLAVAVVGFLLSARFGLEHYADPAVPLSPVIFIVGVVMSFYSAAVYVIVPPG